MPLRDALAPPPQGNPIHNRRADDTNRLAMFLDTTVHSTSTAHCSPHPAEPKTQIAFTYDTTSRKSTPAALLTLHDLSTSRTCSKSCQCQCSLRRSLFCYQPALFEEQNIHRRRLVHTHATLRQQSTNTDYACSACVACTQATVMHLPHNHQKHARHRT